MSSPPNFDRLARPYRWMEYLTFGPFLQRARTHFLPDVSLCRNALVLGDGDGRFTARLLAANPQIRIDAIDASPKMLAALLRSAGSSAPRVRTESADLREWHPAHNPPYDLIATHFLLDCLTTGEVGQLARRLAPAALPGALWLVSDFNVPANAFGRLFAAPLVVALYLAFRWLTNLRLRQLPDHPRALAEAGWVLKSQHSQLGGLLISQIWTR